MTRRILGQTAGGTMPDDVRSLVLEQIADTGMAADFGRSVTLSDMLNEYFATVGRMRGLLSELNKRRSVDQKTFAETRNLRDELSATQQTIRETLIWAKDEMLNRELMTPAQAMKASSALQPPERRRAG
jgi:hypothetical protein